MLLLDFIIIFCEGLRPKPPASGIALLYSDKVDFISAKKWISKKTAVPISLAML